MRVSKGPAARHKKNRIFREAKGFRGAIQRSAMAAITLLTRKYRGLRFVDSVETALEIDPGALPDMEGVAEALVSVGAVAIGTPRGRGAPVVGTACIKLPKSQPGNVTIVQQEAVRKLPDPAPSAGSAG